MARYNNNRNNGRDEMEFEIKQHFGVIGLGTNGWKKEINFVSWNGREAKIDIRDWSEDHTKMGKGLTLTGQELKNFKALLEGRTDDIVLEEPPVVPKDNVPTTIKTIQNGNIAEQLA